MNLVEDFSHQKDESTNQELSQDFRGGKNCLILPFYFVFEFV